MSITVAGCRLCAGLLAVISIGVALGVAVGVFLLFALVACHRRYDLNCPQSLSETETKLKQIKDCFETVSNLFRNCFFCISFVSVSFQLCGQFYESHIYELLFRRSSYTMNHSLNIITVIVIRPIIR